jgi:hypothetical protein
MHHGQRALTLKDKQEKLRALDLYERLPEKIQKPLREDNELMSLIESIEEDAQALLCRNAKRAPILWRHQYVYDRKNACSHRIDIEKGYIKAVDGVETPKMPFSYRNAKKLSAVTLKNR